MKTAFKQRAQNTEKGSVLIESLLAVLIFAIASIGALGMIANSSRSAAELRVRMEAAAYAEDIIGRMQADMGSDIANLLTYDDSNTTAIPPYKAQWVANIQHTLPKSTDTNAPTISVDNASSYASGKASDVTIVIKWQLPGESTPHNFTVKTAIAPNQ